jgi:class 3 adenylate cyclase
VGIERGEIRYATHGDAHLAYRMWGEGSPLLYLPSQFIPIAAMDEEPSYERFLSGLAAFSTVIAFDRQGIGLSDPMRTEPTVEDWAAQGVSVLDAAGLDDAFVLAHAWGGLAGVTMAVRTPTRVRGLVLAVAAGRSIAPPGVAADDVINAARPAVSAGAVDFFALLAPSRADDSAFRQWWDAAGPRGASPSVAQQLLHLQLAADVTPMTKEVQVPTLVVDRPGARFRMLDEPFGADIPGARVAEVGGIDVLLWLPDSEAVVAEVEDFVTGERRVGPVHRQMSTVMFTDVVGSTDAAARLGDRRWRDLLEAHDRMMRSELARHGGQEIDTAGDGFLSTFAMPSDAVRCARRLHDAIAELGLQLRVGIHCGEVEVRGENIAGIAVHLAARVQARSEPGQTLVTSTVREAMIGSGVHFEALGGHELKGVPGSWDLFAAKPT